jgi:hypothetical protein
VTDSAPPACGKTLLSNCCQTGSRGMLRSASLRAQAIRISRAQPFAGYELVRREDDGGLVKPVAPSLGQDRAITLRLQGSEVACKPRVAFGRPAYRSATESSEHREGPGPLFRGRLGGMWQSAEVRRPLSSTRASASTPSKRTFRAQRARR